MITEKELLLASESPTKKDLYQLYPEILELVNKITERWDPTTSNESDPGVVLLKLLAFVADKHNYNIDKNVLECFMPSCTQDDSMRKLCEMMGYQMKYYQSATTTLTMMYQGDKLNDGTGKYIHIPVHTAITNTDNDITFLTLEDVYIGEQYEQHDVEAIEGELVDCKVNDSDLIKLYNLDDNFRYYLPESQIAENGIYVISEDDTTLGSISTIKWDKVNNLNTQRAKSYVWKFGYDSKTQLPYIQFPEDISALIGSGLRISYIRTKGINGNISANTLIKFSSETFKLYDASGTEEEVTLDEKAIIIKNASATSNGYDKESIDDAYNNFKKTIGTFDTLTTCRDYANIIYNLVSNRNGVTPLVSNIQVSDLRDDLNRSFALVTYNSNGLLIKEIARKDGDKEMINHFDLYFYTFKPITGDYSKSSYINSFTYTNMNLIEIKDDLKNYKTISHSIKEPNYTDIIAIKNYYDLKAKITTTQKVNTAESASILSAVYNALYKTFNMRELDWGEEIPYDSILETIKNADTRIKNVSLEEPEITTAFALRNIEYRADCSDATEKAKYKELYKLTVLKNVLAGRVPLLRYEDSFWTRLGETVSSITTEGGALKYSDIYYGKYRGTGDYNITLLKTEARLPIKTGLPITLTDNEVVQFIAPNYTTTITYPSYVNYHLVSPTHKESPIAAGTEYKLKEGDILYINYTDSNDTVHNIKYTHNSIVSVSNDIETVETMPEIGNVIKPNFNLFNSSSLTKKFPKTKDLPTNWPSMYSLSTSEQIEIRDHVKTKLAKTWKCYWLIQDGEIPFNDENNWEYVLQEGEYFFYTNDAMTELVTLGSGTRLYNQGKLTFKLPESDDTVSLEDIASNGIAAFANDVWVTKSFTSTSYLEIQEMQIINLIKDDKLTALTLEDTGLTTLSNDWKAVKLTTSTPCTWVCSDGTSGALTTLAVEGDKWKVRSRLDLNMGPVLSQKLTSRDFIGIIRADTPHGYWKEFQGATGKDLYLRSNYVLQKAGEDRVNVSILLAKSDGTYQNADDLIIKAFDYQLPESTPREGSTPGVIELNDYKTYFSKISFTKGKEFKLNCLIKNAGSGDNGLDQYGLLMLYYINGVENIESSTSLQGAKIKFVNSSGTAVAGIRFFNERNSNGDLTDYQSELILNKDFDNPTKVLLEKLNMIQVKQSGKLIIETRDDKKGNIIISQLEIVNVKERNAVSQPDGDMGVATEVLGLEESATAADNFMKDIWDADTEHIFYYSGAPIDNSTCIDINTEAGEKLSDSSMWYDYNNICNKFVISELDADKFASGITIVSSSRK